MRKTIVVMIVVLSVLLQFCTGTKKTSTAKASKPVVGYTASIAPIMIASCSPCHFPPKGNKAPYDTYATVKGGINEIIDRIKRNPGEKGFMPARHEKLSDSTIQLFVTWKETGFAQ